MIIMALDHVREFFHVGAMSFQPEDLIRTTPLLFMTRWITHICAPVFMFTAGVGAFFWLRRGRAKGQLSRFLWTRGLWLVVLELTALRVALNLNPMSGIVMLTILWALGWSMVALGFLVHLPVRVLAPLSVAIIVLHNLADPVQASRFGGVAWLWNILHQPGMIRVAGIPVLVAYPLVPWFAVMAAGFCFGPMVTRQRWLVGLGLGLTLAFLALRTLNVYGNPTPWTSGVLSFLRCSKYPPSFDFLLMTLGPALLLLAWLNTVELSDRNPLIVFGRVPLFYFLGHLLVAHLLAIPLALARYGTAGFLFHPAPSMGGSGYPADYGYGLGVVYLIWATVVVLLYPLCRWFAGVKARRTDWWLSYL
jgi:uncharacterized membrane protein